MRITDANREEVFRVPLFVKAPGQTTGEVRDDSAQMIDVLPSIVDLARRRGRLGVRRPLAVRRQLADDRAAGVDGRRRRARHRRTARPTEFPHGDDWIGLAAVGDERRSRRLATSPSLEVGTASDYTATIDQAAEFADLPTDDGEMPFAISGTVAGPDEPPELLVAVNGRLAGVIGGYAPAGDGWTFIGYLADLYRRGQQRRGGLRSPPRRRRGHVAPCTRLPPAERVRAVGAGRVAHRR